MGLGFAVGLLASVLARLVAWLVDGRPPSLLASTFIERGVVPHLAFGLVGVVLMLFIWFVQITWPPREDDPAGRTHVWRDRVVPLYAVVVLQWMFRLARRADYDLQRIPTLKIEVGRLVIGILIATALGYVLGGGFSRKRAV